MDSAPPPDQSDLPVKDNTIEGNGKDVGARDVSNLEIGEKKRDVSWVSVAMERKCLKKVDVEVLMKEGKHTVEIPKNALQVTTPLWEDFIVGKFLDIAPHIAKVHMVVNKIWRYGDTLMKVDVYDVDAITMRFRVSNPKAREKILRRGMWNIAGVPMVVKKWSPRAEEEKQEEAAIPMWVHLSKVPLHMFSWEALSFVTSPVGVPVKLHPETLACETFEVAKVFVNVDVSRTLPKEITFIKEGKEFTVEYYYPWLPSRCNLCEKWGHVERVCAKGKKEDKKEVESGSKTKMKEIALVTLDEEEEAVNGPGSAEMIRNGNEGKLVGSTQSQNSGSREVGEKSVESIGRQSTECVWLDVSPGRVGRSATLEKNDDIQISASKFSILSLDTEEGEIQEEKLDMEDTTEGVEQMEELESDLLEDNILSNQEKEKEKSGAKKGMRRLQKTKAQGANPVKSKRSSRRNL